MSLLRFLLEPSLYRSQVWARRSESQRTVYRGSRKLRGTLFGRRKEGKGSREEEEVEARFGLPPDVHAPSPWR